MGDSLFEAVATINDGWRGFMALAGGLQCAKAFHGFVNSCEVGFDSSKIKLSILAFVDNQDLYRMDSILSNYLHPMSCCTRAWCS